MAAAMVGFALARRQRTLALKRALGYRPYAFLGAKLRFARIALPENSEALPPLKMDLARAR